MEPSKEAKPRKLSAHELADLSNDWENPTVDTRKYFQNVLEAWEVQEWVYKTCKANGSLCQVHNGKFYIA